MEIKRSDKGVGVGRCHLRSATGVVDGAGDEQPPGSVDEQGSVIVRDVGALAQKKKPP